MKTRIRGQRHTEGHYYKGDYIHLHMHVCHKARHITKKVRTLLRGSQGLHTLASVTMCGNKRSANEWCIYNWC